MAPQLRQDLVGKIAQLEKAGHVVLRVQSVNGFADVARALQSRREGQRVFPVFDAAELAKQIENSPGDKNMIRAQLYQVFAGLDWYGLRDSSTDSTLRSLVGIAGGESITSQPTMYTEEQARAHVSQFQRQKRASPPRSNPSLAPPVQAPVDRSSATRNTGALTQSQHDQTGFTQGSSAEEAEASAQGLDALVAGKFSIVREIARGGMGAVYEVRQESLEQRLAMKLMLPGAAGPDDIARFVLEAKVTARLDHPNIIRVIDAGRSEGQLYIVMEFIEGDSLKGIVKKNGYVNPNDAARMIIDASRGLHYAHHRGVLHRDIKPHNVMRTTDGVIKVVDFGLAKQAGAQAELTQTGSVVGTPAYMPPEQVTDTKGTDVRSDVYSMGATLYELLTGKPPFEAESVITVMSKVLEEEPRPAREIVEEAGRKLPRDLEVILKKSMDKDPNARYQSAAELADDLERFLNDEPIRARELPLHERARRWARKNPGKLAAYAGVVAALLFGSVGGKVYMDAKHSMRVNDELERAESVEDPLGRLEAYKAVLVLDPSNEEANRRMEGVRTQMTQARYDDTVERVRGLVRAAARRREAGDWEEWNSPRDEYVSARVELENAAELASQESNGAVPAEDVADLERIVEGLGSLDILTEPGGAIVYAFPIKDERGVFEVQGQVVLRYFDANENDGVDGKIVLKEGEEFVRDGIVRADGKPVARVLPGEANADGWPYLEITDSQALRFEGEGYHQHARHGWQRAMNGQTIIIMQKPEEAYAGKGRITRPVVLGRTPLVLEEFPMGNYVLVLEKDGYRDVRVHALVERNEAEVVRGDQDSVTIARAKVRDAQGRPVESLDARALAGVLSECGNGLQLYTDAQINGPDHDAMHSPLIYVPAGPFYSPAERALLWENGFFIAQYEVSNREWKDLLIDPRLEERMEFLRGLPREEGRRILQLLNEAPAQEWRAFLESQDERTRNVLDVERLMPRWQSGRPDGSYVAPWRGGSPQREDLNMWYWPMQGGSAAEAQAFVEAGGYSLPSYRQWVKAAAGTDARQFVWGSRYSPSLVSGPDTPGRDELVPWNAMVATAMDRSVFLVMDLAGNVGEVTSTQDEQGRMILAGGNSSSFSEFSTAHRVRRNHVNRTSNYGVRVTRE